MIPAAKLRGLQQALERDGKVTFPNGAIVTREVEVRIVVEGPWGGISRFTEKEIAEAYRLALEGTRRGTQPKGDPGMFGDDPPF